MPRTRARWALLACAALSVALAASCDDLAGSARDGTNAGLAGADADARHLTLTQPAETRASGAGARAPR